MDAESNLMVETAMSSTSSSRCLLLIGFLGDCWDEEMELTSPLFPRNRNQEQNSVGVMAYVFSAMNQ
jgi:hypothetical protein